MSKDSPKEKVKEKRKISCIWLHFNDIDGKRAQCRYCLALLSYAAGSTGNLGRHMSHKHRDIPLTMPRQTLLYVKEEPEKSQNKPNKLLELLKSWKMVEVYPIFKENKINIRTLRCLQDADIDALITQEKIRHTFKLLWNKWKYKPPTSSDPLEATEREPATTSKAIKSPPKKMLKTVTAISPVKKKEVKRSYESAFDEEYADFGGDADADPEHEPDPDAEAEEMLDEHFSEDHKEQDLYNLLLNWEVPQLYDLLIAHKINIRVLKLMQRKHLDMLLKEMLIGEQVLFEHYFQSWRKKPSNNISINGNYNKQQISTNNDNTHIEFGINTDGNSSSTLAVNVDTSAYTQAGEHSTFRVVTILRHTLEGKSLVEEYEENKTLKHAQRNKLVNMIVDDLATNGFGDEGLTMDSIKDMQLEKEIIQLFPTEKIEYYVERNQGVIYTRLKNNTNLSAANSSANPQAVTIVPRSTLFANGDNL